MNVPLRLGFPAKCGHDVRVGNSNCYFRMRRLTFQERGKRGCTRGKTGSRSTARSTRD